MTIYIVVFDQHWKVETVELIGRATLQDYFALPEVRAVFKVKVHAQAYVSMLNQIGA